MVNYNRYFLTVFTLDVKSIVSLHWSRLHKDSKRRGRCTFVCTS